MTHICETRPFGAAGLWNSSLHFERDDPENIQHPPARQAQNALRLRFLATRLYALGPKPFFHFLEVERGANLRDCLEEYSRPLADFVKGYRGDMFLPAVHLVPGSGQHEQPGPPSIMGARPRRRG
jgi:hypothetical protein